MTDRVYTSTYSGECSGCEKHIGIQLEQTPELDNRREPLPVRCGRCGHINRLEEDSR
jgi:hypothetical protein